MGKVLEFKPRSVPEEVENEAVFDSQQFRSLFSDEEVEGIKQELDFLDELENMVPGDPNLDVLRGEES